GGEVVAPMAQVGELSDRSRQPGGPPPVAGRPAELGVEPEERELCLREVLADRREEALAVDLGAPPGPVVGVAEPRVQEQHEDVGSCEVAEVGLGKALSSAAPKWALRV